MTLREYGVLVGRVLEGRSERGADTPHYQVRVDGGGVEFRVAVNVLSQQAPSELLYVADPAFRHPLLANLPSLAAGFSPVPSRPGGVALDFIRGNLFGRTAMRPLPSTAPGPDNDLADALEHFVDRAVADPAARLYAFGQRWGPEPGKPDKIFGFTPGNGVHDIHMNQGNSGRFRGDNGVWQDGGLLLHYPAQDQWVAIFLAFQSQAWHTDDRTGDPLPGTTPPPDTTPPPEPDHVVRIVGALVNPPGPAPEAESVTLLNASPAQLDLTGWSIVDGQKHGMPLEALTLPAGGTACIPLRVPVQLGNHGGIVSLLNAEGLKVDGVAYTADQARREGWTIVF
jgi:uncharacterized protein YukJ